MSVRQVVAGAARTTMSAPVSAASGAAVAVSTTASATAFRGPSPDGDQAVIAQSAVSGFVRIARAIEPPMRPKPRNARCMSASIAVSAGGSPADGRRPTAAATGLPTFGEPALGVAGSCAFALWPWRPGIIGRVHPPVGHPSLRLTSFRSQEGTAARTSTLFGEERLEGGHRVDLTTTRPAGESWHRAVRVRPAAGLPTPHPPCRAGIHSPRASHRGSARTTPGRSGHGRTG